MIAQIEKMHLYVMQNAVGCIKVGRGVDPEKRRQEIERQTSRTVKLVAAFPNSGHHEEGVHLFLRRFHLHSEWFRGTDAARSAIVKAIIGQLLDGRSQKAQIAILERGVALFEWPFRWSPGLAEQWIGELKAKQIPTRIRRERVRLIGFLKAIETGLVDHRTLQGNRFDDARIWFEVYDRAERCRDPSHRMSAQDGEVPEYTNDLDAALSLWPAENRPNEWLRKSPGSTEALNCCIAGLGMRWGIDPDKIKPRLN